MMNVPINTKTVCSQCGKAITYIEEKRGRKGETVQLWAHDVSVRHIATPFSLSKLTIALTKSIEVQNSYAKLLNAQDGKERTIFDIKAWIDQLH
jgi:hypothetical protein